MSVQAMSWVFDHSFSEGTNRLVLLAIADQAAKDGTNAYPGVESIAKMAAVSERTVQRAKRALVDLGELRVEPNAGGSRELRNDQRPDRYTVLMWGVVDATAMTDAERRRAPLRRGLDEATPLSPRHEYGVLQGEATPLSPRDVAATRHGCHPVTANGVTNPAERGDSQRAHEVTTVSPDPREDPKDPSTCADNIGASASGSSIEQRRALWDALAGELGIEPKTRTERGRFSKAVRDLCEIGATPIEIRRVVRAYRRQWPLLAVSANAIVAHWSEFARSVPPATFAERAARRECAACDSTGFICSGPDATPCPDCHPVAANA